MEWGWPQYAFAGLLLSSLVFHLYSDGKRGGGWSDVAASVLVFALQAGILYAGGFWG